MDFIAREAKIKKKSANRGSYLMDTIDPEKLVPQGTFKKEERLTTDGDQNKKKVEGNTPDSERVISENLSEISANDFGYFSYKIKDEVIKPRESEDPTNSPKLKKKKTKAEDENIQKYNLVRHLGESRDSSDKNGARIAKNRVEIVTHIAKEENDYILLDVINVQNILADLKKRVDEIKEKVLFLINCLG